MSVFETNWSSPHRDEAAQMGRKMGADLVLYVVVPTGTRLQSVPHITYEPGQTYTRTTTGVVGGTLGHSKPMALRLEACTRNTRRRKLVGTRISSLT